MVESKSYAQTDNPHQKPLMIGCSGGGGHISAIKGVKEYLSNLFKNQVYFPEHALVHYDQRKKSFLRQHIHLGIKIINAPVVGAVLQKVMKQTPLPILPTFKKITDEFKKLHSATSRHYVDVLLDAYPAGYESAAIWNVLQREGRVAELKKLIGFQPYNETNNHKIVYQYYFDLLIHAAQEGQPYTEIVSTTAIAFAALCDAVKKYNEWLNEQSLVNIPPICLHQYMTDLPTKGSVHFFQGLSLLTATQQAQMKLYGVGLSEAIIQEFFPQGNHFAGLFNVSSKDNPMVRPGFSDPELDNSGKLHEEVTLRLKGITSTKMKDYSIAANEEIATIMLGSQAEDDTYNYIETLIKNGIAKIFVFGAHNNPEIKDKIALLVQKHPDYASRIISLGHQDDKQMAPLMTRSNMIIIRGGGLSVMEQLAMNHHPEQSVFIHHADSLQKELSSGISWEDDNVKILIRELQKIQVHCEKTSPCRAKRHIAEGRLISFVKRVSFNIDINDTNSHIKKMSSEELEFFVEQLKNPDQAREYLTNYFSRRESAAQGHLNVLNNLLTQQVTYLEKIIIAQIKKLKNMSPYLLADSFNVEKIAFESHHAAFKNTGPAFHKATAHYRAIHYLQSFIKANNEVSANRQLINFIKIYKKPEIKTQLVSKMGLIQKILEYIRTILATYFPALQSPPKFSEVLEKHLSQLQRDEIAPESLQAYSMFSTNSQRGAMREEDLVMIATPPLI